MQTLSERESRIGCWLFPNAFSLDKERTELWPDPLSDDDERRQSDCSNPRFGTGRLPDPGRSRPIQTTPFGAERRCRPSKT
jgi:hypothetical protein